MILKIGYGFYLGIPLFAVAPFQRLQYQVEQWNCLLNVSQGG